jgi:hypothetical protein
VLGGTSKPGIQILDTAILNRIVYFCEILKVKKRVVR